MMIKLAEHFRINSVTLKHNLSIHSQSFYQTALKPSPTGGKALYCYCFHESAKA